MKTLIKHIHTKSLLAGAFLGVVTMFCIGAATGTRTIWEYKVVTGEVAIPFGSPLPKPPMEKSLDDAASGGWDLISVSYAGEGRAFGVLRREKK